MHDKLFMRVSGLFDVEAFAGSRVLIAGCGSGGGQVALQLAISGVKQFTLIDKDLVETENVIRHVCGLNYVGERKIDALCKVLQDRNPTVDVRKFDEDLLTWKQLEPEIKCSSIVVLATDNDPTRFRINELCVKNQIPFVVGRVFTRGIGGEVFSYQPKGGGCLACLESVLERTRFRDGVREIDLVSDEEREQLYGLDPREIKDSPGLAVDIGFITLFHVRFVLDTLASLAPKRPKFLTPISENYLVWGNRAVHPFNRNFELQKIKLQQQDKCFICRGQNDV